MSAAPTVDGVGEGGEMTLQNCPKLPTSSRHGDSEPLEHTAYTIFTISRTFFIRMWRFVRD